MYSAFVGIFSSTKSSIHTLYFAHLSENKNKDGNYVADTSEASLWCFLETAICLLCFTAYILLSAKLIKFRIFEDSPGLNRAVPMLIPRF